MDILAANMSRYYKNSNFQLVEDLFVIEEEKIVSYGTEGGEIRESESQENTRSEPGEEEWLKENLESGLSLDEIQRDQRNSEEQKLSQSNYHAIKDQFEL